MEKINLITDDIVLRAQKGEVDAFSKIYSVYSNKVYFVAMQFFQNEHTAKDIVQEVFIRVHQKLDTLKEPKAFHNWILQITYHACCNQKRKNIKLVDLGKLQDIEDFEDKSIAKTSDIIANKFLKETILDSLSTLSTPLKSVGILRFHEGLKIEEIATILNIPVGTVNSRLNKIKKVLQVDLKKKGISPNLYTAVIVNPFILNQAYKLLSSYYTIEEDASNLLLYQILNRGFFSKILQFRDAILLSLISFTLIVTGVILLNYGQLPVVKSKAYEKSESARITNITYDKGWTNKPIQLDVKTSSNEFDEILINGIRDTKIYKNGAYSIQLIYKKNVIDEQKINIHNLDIHSPTGYSYRDGATYTIHLQEDESGINPSSLRFYKNGIQHYDYTYDDRRHVITVNSFVGTIDFIYISDYAGNELEIKIK